MRRASTGAAAARSTSDPPRLGCGLYAGTTTHYQTLGVAQGATTDQIRQAYRQLARELHPDRHLQSPPAEAATASRRMQDVNAAWAVLSNAGARDLYDLELNLARSRAGNGSRPSTPAPAHRASGTAPSYRPPVYDVPRHDVAARPGMVVFRGLPWVIVLVVLGFIFVFTAFAAGGGNDANGGASEGDATGPASTVPTPPRAGDCVRIVSATDIGVVDCGLAHDGQIAQVVPMGRPCASDTTGVYLPDLAQYACIRRSVGS